ncbi:MAG: hypothetical protein ACKVPY_09535 [Paracoccaceae bacterium]
MNSQSPPLISTDEDICIALDRLEAFRKDGLAHPLEDVRAWVQARQTDPDAPCPPAKPLR